MQKIAREINLILAKAIDSASKAKQNPTNWSRVASATMKKSTPQMRQCNRKQCGSAVYASCPAPGRVQRGQSKQASELSEPTSVGGQDHTNPVQRIGRVARHDAEERNLQTHLKNGKK